MAHTPQLKGLVDDVENLISLPEVVIKANELINSGTSTIDDIAELVSLDPSLSAKLLKLVNSPFYGFPAKIDTISRAITLIGLTELRSLIFSASAVDAIERIAPDSLDMNDFWLHSVFVGLAAKHILDDRKMSEQLFLMGLMHNLGIIVLASQCRETSARIRKTATDTGRPVFEVEKEVLGYTCTDISAALMQRWKLAESLWKPVQHIHHPDQAGEHQRYASILNLAKRLDDCSEPDSKRHDSATLSTLQMDSELLRAAGAEEADLEAVISEVNLGCLEVCCILYPGAMMVY
jgi:HD-like signal output (HDOD) protein